MGAKTIYTKLAIVTDSGIKIKHLNYSLKFIHPKTKNIQIISPNRLQSFDGMKTKEHSWKIERPNHKEKFLGYFDKEFTDKEFEDYLKQFKAVFTLYLNDQPLGVEFYCPVFLKSGETFTARWKLSQAETQRVKTVEERKFGCLHSNAGAEAIASYIAEEMNKNINDPVTRKLRHLNTKAMQPLTYFETVAMGQHAYNAFIANKIALNTQAYLLFQEQIDYDKPWDHKPKIAANPKFRVLSLDGNSRKEGRYHRYKDFDYFYDVWSNIHYGFIGRVCGFTEWELNYGAGAAQLITDAQKKAETWQVVMRGASLDSKRWDNPEDQITIGIGYVMYNEYTKGRKPSKERILELLDLADESKLRDAKTWHKNNCHNGEWVKPKSNKDKLK